MLGAISATVLAATAARAQDAEPETPAAEPAQTGRPGEYLITGAHLLTMDDKLGEIASGAVHVRDGAIVAVGTDLQAPGAQRIEAHGAVVMPGFVETHWHLWATLARGLGAKGGFDKAMAALAPKFGPQDNALGVRLPWPRRRMPASPPSATSPTTPAAPRPPAPNGRRCATAASVAASTTAIPTTCPRTS
ncbi:hypothetical protein ACFQU7_04830 [Pseudoroseomonas wenyumeiae]